MPVTAKRESGDFEKLPTGPQAAVCCGVHDLGMQQGFQGKLQHKVVIVWELSERRKQEPGGGQRFTISNTYTLSLSEKANLTKDLISWRGVPLSEEELSQGFDIERLIGANCTLNLVEVTKPNKSPRVVVQGIMPPIRGTERLVAEHNREWMPKWVKDLLTHETAPTDEDDIPF